MTIVLLLLGAVLLLIPLVVRPLLVWRSGQKRSQHTFIAKFYEIAPGLVADKRLSDDLAQMLETISQIIDDRRVVRSLLLAWLHGEIGNHSRAQQQRDFAANIAALPPDLRERFMSALAFGLVAATYVAPFSGTLLRRLLFMPVGMPERTDDAPRFARALAA